MCGKSGDANVTIRVGQWQHIQKHSARNVAAVGTKAIEPFRRRVKSRRDAHDIARPCDRDALASLGVVRWPYADPALAGGCADAASDEDIILFEQA